MRSILACPVCQQALSKQDDLHYCCEKNHHFDLGKAGYLNLLLSQHKHSKSPGDDAAMVIARREFLQQGHYQPISDALNHYVAEHASDAPTLLDLGCGEGYYTHRLQQALSDQQPQLIGLDISKEAIKKAAKLNKQITWLVASSVRPPVLQASCEWQLSLFSRVDWKVSAQIAAKQGYLVLAAAHDDHLLGLREKIYQTVRRHDSEKFIKTAESFWNLHDQIDVQFDLDLCDNASINALLGMTPYFWSLPAEKREALKGLQHLQTPVNVRLYIFKVCE